MRVDGEMKMKVMKMDELVKGFMTKQKLSFRGTSRFLQSSLKLKYFQNLKP